MLKRQLPEPKAPPMPRRFMSATRRARHRKADASSAPVTFSHARIGLKSMLTEPQAFSGCGACSFSLQVAYSPIVSSFGDCFHRCTGLSRAMLEIDEIMWRLAQMDAPRVTELHLVFELV